MWMLFNLLMPLLFIGPKQGAETSVYVATAPELADVTGRYFVKKREETITPIGTDATNRDRLRDLTKQYVRQYV